MASCQLQQYISQHPVRSLKEVNDELNIKISPHENVINGVVNYMASPLFLLTRMRKPLVKELNILLIVIGYSTTRIKKAKKWHDKAHLVMMWLKQDKSPVEMYNLTAKSVASQYPDSFSV